MTLSWPASDYAQHRTMVVPRFSVVFIPVPKTGCTSLLWLLARASLLNPARFIDSGKPEVTRTMAIHDLDLWPEAYRWDRLSKVQQARIEGDDDWLRLTVVRHPGRRVWSAWQDKILLRHPSFVERFGGSAWFPDKPGSPDSVVADFRAFVRALGGSPDHRPIDPHWTPQATLHATAPEPNHLGRTEDLAAVVNVLANRVGPEHAVSVERENSGVLPYHPALFDRECRELVNELYAEDFARYGYEPLAASGEGLDGWADAAAPLIAATIQLVDRHQRIGDLYRAVRRLNMDPVG